ncbi:MAG TPA: hypothetical protein DCZ95_02805 [Verrucomicrobia bacterium]|nr:MAG: hypothetical protein A2X46_14870 [Lentisphaerae bacterium GWF2_57_35]HBA83002.1 hypothetical protein [Verrucomicrobiota bacterium]
MSPKAWRPLLQFAGQLVLSAVVAAVFFILARVAGSAWASFQAPPPAVAAAPRGVGGYASAPPARLWPLYPSFHPSGVRAMTINGIEILSEDGELKGSAADVLAYYGRQMAARGWSDVTEESFNLSEGLQAAGNDPQLDEQFFKTYNDIMESNLAFRRGCWTVVMNLSPGLRPWTMHIRISAYNTPTVQDIMEALVLTPLEKAPKDGVTMRAEETVSGSRIRTLIYESPLPPSEFYIRQVDSLKAARWSPVFLSPAREEQARLFAVFQKGGRYTYVIVNPSRSGRGSSAVVSEMDEGRAAIMEQSSL